LKRWNKTFSPLLHPLEFNLYSSAINTMAEDTNTEAQASSGNAQPEITLYWLEQSRSQRVVWLLEELQVPYKLKLYHRNKDHLADPALKKVHPLGKSPVVGIKPAGGGKEIVLAESGFIVEYLVDHFGKGKIESPRRYKEGLEGQVGGETEEWLRYRYFLHYAEGSLMTPMLVAFLFNAIKTGPVPFFIRPIINGIYNKVNSLFLEPNFKTHFTFLEDQISTSPGGGQYLCGEKLTGADILMSFPLIAGKERGGLTKDKYPKLVEYIERLEAQDGYKRAIQKIEEVDSSFSGHLKL